MRDTQGAGAQTQGAKRMVADAGQGAEKRRPQEEDLEPLLERLWEGKSLRAACGDLGLHVPSTSDWLHADEGRREQYARAREGRAEYLQEDALTVNLAAALGVQVAGKKVDPSGAKGYLEATKFAIGRMAPKTLPPQRVEHSGHIGTMTDDELAQRIAAMESRVGAED